MSSGHVSDIANQPLMPGRPEEIHRESLTSRVAELKWELPRIADFRGRSIGLGLLALGEGYPRRFFCSAGVRSWPKAVQPTRTAMSVGSGSGHAYVPVAQSFSGHGLQRRLGIPGIEFREYRLALLALLRSYSSRQRHRLPPLRGSVSASDRNRLNGCIAAK